MSEQNKKVEMDPNHFRQFKAVLTGVIYAGMKAGRTGESISVALNDARNILSSVGIEEGKDRWADGD